MSAEGNQLFVPPSQMHTGFWERFGAAFNCISRTVLPSSILQGKGSLRSHLAAAFLEVGYASVPEPRDLRIVILSNFLWEERHVPYLILHRHAASWPLVQYAVYGTTVTLRVFGPLAEGRTAPYAQIDIDCTNLLGIAHGAPETGIAAVRHGISVGVHTWERFFRTADINHHQAFAVTGRAASTLERLFTENLLRCDILTLLLPALSPFLMLVGHDCYEETIDTNAALRLGESVFLQPKGKPCKYFSPGSTPGHWLSDKTVFLSHLNFWFSSEVRRRWSSIEPVFIQEARLLMEKRMERLDALPYMRNVIYRDVDSDVMVGWRNFRDVLSIPVWDPAMPDDTGRPTWIFSLHSFADESFRWGADHVWSLFDLFMTIAVHIRATYPLDRVVIRPHPNTLEFFTDQTILQKVETGELKFPPTAYLDICVQIRLCQHIAALGLDCEFSPLLPARDILSSQRSIVVTRHGSLAIEAAWLGRCSVFSRIAPYSFLFPAAQQYWDIPSLQDSLNLTRDQVLSGDFRIPEREDLLRYQAILDTPHGERRAVAMGEVMYPYSRHQPMRDFDDFVYQKESVAEAVERLRSCLGADVERKAFDQVVGIST